MCLRRSSVLGVGKIVIIQTRNVQQRRVEIDRRLAVGRVERPVLRRMLVHAKLHMEGAFDIRRRAFNVDHQPVDRHVD